MNTKMNLICLLLAFLFSTTVLGQGFLERVAKKASDKVEQNAQERAEKKMDEKIDEGFDEMERSLEEKEGAAETSKETKESRDQRRMSALMQKMGVSSGPVPIADKYHFSSKMVMHFKNLESNGKVRDEGDVITYLRPGEKNFAYEFTSEAPSGHEGPKKGVFIMDYTNGATIILSEEDGRKTGVVYGINLYDETMEEDEGYVEEYEEDVEEYEEDEVFMNPHYKKTGQSKSISGYKCEEYVFDNEEEKGSFWVTDETEWKTNDNFSAIFRAGLYSHGVYKGMLMESESINKETGEKNMMQVTEFNDAVSVDFIPGEYELTNLGSMNFNQAGEDEVE